MGNNSFLENTVSYFDKIMKQKYIEKTNVLQLKNQFRQLKQYDPSYKNLFNRVTTLANNAKGNNKPDILQNLYEDFKNLQS